MNPIAAFCLMALLAEAAAATGWGGIAEGYTPQIGECERIGAAFGNMVAQEACAALLNRSAPPISTNTRPTFNVGSGLPDVLESAALQMICSIIFQTACLDSSFAAASTVKVFPECRDRLSTADREGWLADMEFFDQWVKSSCDKQAANTASAPPDEIVSRNRPTFQSTTAFGGVSSRAVDGNMNANYGANSCTHTGFSERDYATRNPWWAVDLGTTRKITRIKITNRGDCCSERLNNFEIRVGDVTPLGDGTKDNSVQNPLCSSGSLVPRGETQEIDCKGAGRYVTLRLPGDARILTLCEVEVYAEVERSLLFTQDALLSRSKPTLQSSTGYGGWSGRAVDGNKGAVYSWASCTHTLQSANPWWAVDLSSQQKVTRIRVTNRSDCCAGRLSNFEIRVGDVRPSGAGQQNAICRERLSVPRGQTFEFECRGTGRFVTIRIPGNHKILTLCEVEVLG